VQARPFVEALSKALLKRCPSERPRAGARGRGRRRARLQQARKLGEVGAAVGEREEERARLRQAAQRVRVRRQHLLQQRRRQRHQRWLARQQRLRAPHG